MVRSLMTDSKLVLFALSERSYASSMRSVSNGLVKDSLLESVKTIRHISTLAL